ncbi:bifunctional metallophosphatase/5'-nucleotidase [Idiomarina sp.]|uniref:bifunctional metallophosphatase/5'-nucleotidase n=1 Tax=Idiomarina sp. TaxID=1874361 RepID=UPI003A8D5B0D
MKSQERLQSFKRFVIVGVFVFLSVPAFSQRFEKVKVEQYTPHEQSPFDSVYKAFTPSNSDASLEIAWPENWPDSSAKKPLSLRVFHFNDLHNKLIIPDDVNGDTRVMAQIAAHIQEARSQQFNDKEKNRGVLFLSAGDDHTGAVYDELLGTDETSFKKSLAYYAYSAAGVDAATLGNHEFDRGTSVLKKAINQDAKFPLLSANLAHSDNLTTNQYASALLGTIDQWRIAIIGLTSAADTKTNLADDPNLTMRSEINTLEQLMPALQDKVDLVIALTHIGYRQAGKVGDQDVAMLLSEYDVPSVVIGGHSHDLLHAGGYSIEHEYGDVPVFQAGQWGQYLGEVKIEIQPTEHGPRMIMNESILHKIRKHDAANQTPRKELEDKFQEMVLAPVLADFASVINESMGEIKPHPYLSKDRVLEDRYTTELALANFMTDAALETMNNRGEHYDLLAINASSIVDGLPDGGTPTFSDWYAVIPYADVLHRIELTPDELEQLVKSNAKRLVKPTEKENLDLTGFINRGFLHFSSALRYGIRVDAEEAFPKAVNIEFNGKPLSAYEGQTISLLVGDYIASGNLGWRGQSVSVAMRKTIQGYNLMSLSSRNTGFMLRNQVLEYLRKRAAEKTIDIREDGRLFRHLPD